MCNSDGVAIAVAPVFLKYDSTGEYVFDYSWADAYQQLFSPTRSYYPKLQIAVPFTPVPGPRLLIDPALSKQERALAQNLFLTSFLQLAQNNALSSVHVTFCEQGEAELACSELPYLHRIGEQYHWFNQGYDSFEDFLGQLSSRKRKAIRRERKIAQGHPVSFHTVHGHEASPEQWDAMHALYVRTARSKWGRPYLNREFFRLLGERLADKVVLFLVRCETDGDWLAGAWNLRGKNALFGRNWGCRQELPMLHFEVCYYLAIDYAIAHKLTRVEAGAQGLHKIQRGYQPVATHSVHYLQEPQFAALVADYLVEERREELERLAQLQELSPFRQPPPLQPQSFPT